MKERLFKMVQKQTNAARRRQEVENFIINNYQHLTYKEIGEQINVSKSTIQNVMRKHGLNKSGYDVKYYRKVAFQLKDLLDEFSNELDETNPDYEKISKELQNKYKKVDIV